MATIETPAGYRIPVMSSKPKRGDEKFVLEYYNGTEHVRKLTYDGEKWV